MSPRRVSTVARVKADSFSRLQALLAWRSSRWPETLPQSNSAPDPASTPTVVPPRQPAATTPATSRPPFIPPGRSFPSRAVARPPPRNGAATSSATPAPTLSITAADPFTSPAYRARTGLPCLKLSFADVAAGLLPPPGSSDSPAEEGADFVDQQIEPYDLVIISFALHLVESSSELWALLRELSRRAKWLCVTAPHKKPDVSSPIQSLRSPSKKTLIRQPCVAGQRLVGLAKVGSVRRVEASRRSRQRRRRRRRRLRDCSRPSAITSLAQRDFVGRCVMYG